MKWWEIAFVVAVAVAWHALFLVVAVHRSTFEDAVQAAFILLFMDTLISGAVIGIRCLYGGRR